MSLFLSRPGFNILSFGDLLIDLLSLGDLLIDLLSLGDFHFIKLSSGDFDNRICGVGTLSKFREGGLGASLLCLDLARDLLGLEL